jgi:hypothetical protein
MRLGKGCLRPERQHPRGDRRRWHGGDQHRGHAQTEAGEVEAKLQDTNFNSHYLAYCGRGRVWLDLRVGMPYTD